MIAIDDADDRRKLLFRQLLRPPLRIDVRLLEDDSAVVRADAVNVAQSRIDDQIQKSRTPQAPRNPATTSGFWALLASGSPVLCRGFKVLQLRAQPPQLRHLNPAAGPLGSRSRGSDSPRGTPIRQ